MPKAFLIRKRATWKASCGIVTPPPSPEQTTQTTTTNKVPPKTEQTHHQSLAGEIVYVKTPVLWAKTFARLIFSWSFSLWRRVPSSLLITQFVLVKKQAGSQQSIIMTWSVL
ncbi:hypothetical protein CEXT_649251 [Caerostris extrusa]|uniref:Uncharacterized protein n=1 Tax=Caerostris extrusa TaxID=172846 RepID=A0AAV4XYK5_CAEEX|nr:hypothetical protein CEXT_649251 [Caerostris extrusa]